MSVSVVKEGGAFTAVYTVVSEVKSMFPPAVPLLSALSRGPPRAPRGSCEVGALGTIQIMVGLFNIGLGPGRTSWHPDDLTDLRAAYWLGAVYIAAGIVSLVADQCGNRCFAGFAIFMNIVCAIFSVTGIVLYAIDLSDTSVYRMCSAAAEPSDNCRYVANFFQRLMTAMDVTLIVLSVLLLVVSIVLAVLGFRAVFYRRKQQEASRISFHT